MKTSVCRDGALKNHPNKMGMTPQHIHTIPTVTTCANYVLCHLCTHRVVEGSGLGSAGCVVHVDVHGEWVVLWVAATQLLLSNADMICLVCRSCGVAQGCWCVSYAAKLSC